MTTVGLDRGTTRKFNGAISPEHDHHGFALYSDPVAMAFAAMGRRPHLDDGGPVDPDDQVRTGPGYTPGPYQPTPATDAAGTAENQRWGSAIVQAGMNVANGIGSAVTLPRDVMQGTVDPMSDEGIERAANLATMLPGAGMPMAEAGALGSAGGAMTVDKLKALWDFDFEALPPHPETPPASAAELRHRVDSLNPNGLPVDEASRLGRARDLGFDTSTPLYHGTTSSWEGTGFRETDGRTNERATFLTPDPQVANAYARSPYARAFDSTEGNILPVYARMRNPKVIDMEGSGYADASVHDAIEDARSAGHDGVVFHNMIDMSGPNLDQVPQTQVAVFHPRNIRSVFGTFDPAMEGSTDLMSAGGISALPSSSANDQLPYGQPPVVGPDGVTRGNFARGGAVDHGSMSPDAHASKLLQDQGIDRPSVGAIRHLSAELGVRPDPVRVALALAQASHADGTGYALSNLEALHDLNHVAARAGSPQASPMHGVVGPARDLHPAVAAAFAAMEPEAAQRAGFAQGGAISGLPPHTPMHPAVAAAFAAMNQRPHFDDGGGEGGGAGGGDSSHSSGGGSSSGGEGGGSSSGGEGGGGEGGGGSSSSGGDNGNSSSNSNSSSSGGHSDASTGGGSSGDGGSEGGSSGGGGGFSSGAASGSDSGSSGGRSDASSSGGYGGGSSSSDASSSGGGFSSGAASGADTSGMGGGVSGGYGSATSGDVGSIGGSVGAPAAGGFSGAGEAATGGFGSFGPGPASSDNTTGMSGATPTASSISGQTAQQSMASEASTGGDPGEDGTGSGLGGVTTAGAFGSFGPSPASPYGSTANAQGAFNGTQASDLSGAAGLSPMGQQLGMMGLGSMPSGEMANPNGFASPGAYGLSTTTGGITPGFDNFSSTGNVQQSSLGDTGYTGYGGASLDPAASYSTTSGVMSGAMVGALQGGLADPEARATDLGDLSKGFNPDYSGFALGPDGKPTYAGNMGVFSGIGGPAAGSEPTGGAAGLNADGDPTAVAGTSALTIHGNQTEAAQGGYDAPGPATTYGGITDKQAFDARQNIVNGVGTAADQAVASGYVSQQNSPVGRTVGLGNVAASVGAAPSVAGAPAGLSPSADAGGSPGTAPGGSSDGATSGPAAATLAPDPSTGIVDYSAYNTRVAAFEDPTGKATNPTTGAFGHYQFTPATWDGVSRNYPGLGLPARAQDATEAQRESAQNALTGENVAAAQKVGLTPTFGTMYGFHLMGAPVASVALSKSDDTPIGQSGIPSSYRTANPSVFNGVQTVGDLKGRLDSIMGSGVVTGAAAPSGIPASVQQALQRGPANYSPGAASGMDTTDTAAPSVNPGISPPSTWSPGVATPATTQTVSTPAPYGVTPTTSATLNAFGMSSTPANALAGETLGYGVASQIMNGAPNDPVESAGISATTIAANPSLFAGVKTVGDLQANIAKAAETAGTTTSTVTTPGAPAAEGALPGYSYSPGAASGLDSVDPAAASFGISPPNAYTAPTGVPTGAPATPAKNAPEADAPDAPTPSHLSVPTGVTNFGANLGLGMLGPIGMGIAGANMVSGLFGGPTIGSALNGAMAAIGSGSGGGSAGYSSGGNGDNSNQPGREGDYNQPVPTEIAQATPDGNVGISSSGGAATTSSGTSDPAPLTIHRIHQLYGVPRAAGGVYNPLTDPVVMRALAAMKS